jgi:hypothetical protein
MCYAKLTVLFKQGKSKPFPQRMVLCNSILLFVDFSFFLTNIRAHPLILVVKRLIFFKLTRRSFFSIGVVEVIVFILDEEVKIQKARGDVEDTSTWDDFEDFTLFKLPDF